jgi:tetratricopeptide (TPR) repeat protein
VGYRIFLSLAAVLLLSSGLTGRGEPAWNGPAGQEDDLVQKYEAADAHFFRAEGYFLKQDLPDARTELDECLKLMPEHSGAHFLLAQVDFREGYYSRALTHIIKAEDYYDFALTIRGEQQQRLLLELQRMRDEQESILAELERALARTSNDFSRMTLESRILQARKIKSSIEDRLLSPGSPVSEGPAEFHVFHGEILVRLRRYPEAETQFRLAISLAPTSPEAYEELAGMLLLTRHARIAQDVVEEAESKGIAIDEKLKESILKALGK